MTFTSDTKGGVWTDQHLLNHKNYNLKHHKTEDTVSEGPQKDQRADRKNDNIARMCGIFFNCTYAQ